jgi:hypothetical protein
MFRTVIFLTTLIVAAESLCTGLAIVGKAAEDIFINPNEKVQSFLHSLASTNLQERRKLFSGGTEEELQQKYAEVQEIAGGTEQLIAQLLYCRVHAKTMEEAIVPLFVAEQLGLSKDDIAEGLLPYLESDDRSVVKEASEWLGGTDRALGIEADLSRYEKILREKQGEAPMGLLRYMFDRDPQAAVVTVARVYGGPDVPETEVAAKVKSGVKESVDYFAGRPEWWAHLYVAAMMEKEPYLRTPEMIEKLEQDPDPLVREKVSAVKEKLQLK